MIDIVVTPPQDRIGERQQLKEATQKTETEQQQSKEVTKGFTTPNGIWCVVAESADSGYIENKKLNSRSYWVVVDGEVLIDNEKVPAYVKHQVKKLLREVAS